MSKHSVAADDISALLLRFDELKRKAKVRTKKSFPIIAIPEPNSTASGCTACWKARASKATWSIRRRSPPRGAGAGPRPTGSTARRCCARFSPLSAGSHGSAPWPFLHPGGGGPATTRTRAQDAGRRARRTHQPHQGAAVLAGITGYEPIARDRRERLDELTTGDGRPLPSHLKALIVRELDRLELLLQQIKAVEAERDALLAESKSASAKPPVGNMLLEFKGIGPELASVSGRKGCSATSTIDGRSPPTPDWRRRHGRADRSVTIRACRRPATHVCEPP